MTSAQLIELAPHNKRGLAISSPVIAGSGAAGFGDVWGPGLGPEAFGAVVTAPISLHPRRGRNAPRLAEIPGGFLLATDDHNPGYRRLFREHGGLWTRLTTPIIVALAASTPEDWDQLAGHLEETGGIAGIELHILPGARRGDVAVWIAAVRRTTTLPVWTKVPSNQAEELAEMCAHEGADALVVGLPPAGAYPVDGTLLVAPVAGPAALPFTLRALAALRGLHLDLPIIASGGIRSASDARWCLEAGASAVQVRSLLWTDPGAAAALASELASRRLAPRHAYP